MTVILRPLRTWLVGMCDIEDPPRLEGAGGGSTRNGIPKPIPNASQEGNKKTRRLWLAPRRRVLSSVLILLAILSSGCGTSAPDDGADEHVTTQGTIEVTAKLVDIAGEFPPNDLYDYAYVMKYEVEQLHRGDASGLILVGQYNPLKNRAEAADARSGEIGGNVTRFRVGDRHRLALDVPIDDYCMAGIVNKYAETEPSDAPIYWALWTNRVVP